MREKIDLKPKKQFTKKKVEEAYSKLRQQASIEYATSMFDALAILFDANELRRSIFQLELFGVIVLQNPTSGNPYAPNVPHIITNNNIGTPRLLYHDGRVDCSVGFGSVDEPRPATDEEIEACINNLNERQWAMVMNAASIFNTLVAEAMTSEVDVLDIGSDEAKHDGAEIETNGRRITIGKE